MNFETIKRNYERKLWSKAMVKVAVKKGVISANEYKEIIGDDYSK